MPPLGTLLVNLSQSILTLNAPAGLAFAAAIPADCRFIGILLYCQAASIDALSSVSLTNALDIRIGNF